jgi:uncharacterized RDD family membrane protein YckC
MLAVYALKRIAAYIIDFALIYTPITILLSYGQATLVAGIPQQQHLHMFAAMGSWGISILAPVLVTGTLIGLTGRTPGKLIMFLRVIDCGAPPGIAQGILREIIKTVSMTFFFLGPIWALHGLVTRGETFYDTWLGLQVEDLRPYGLSETQKNWRKFHRQQARLKKKSGRI